MKLLGRDTEDRRTAGIFYVSVVQSVLLFGSETWVITPRLENTLKGFHHKVVRRMAGMGTKRKWDGKWLHTPIGLELEMVGLDDIGVYIARCQNTVAQYIVNRTIMELCLVVDQNLGLRLSRRWWEHPAIDILGII